MFDYFYNWILYDILGFTTSTQEAFMLEPFALFLTYIAIIFVLWSLIYLVKWVIKFVSVLFPWA